MSERLKLFVVWMQSNQYENGKKLVPKGIKENYRRWVDLNKDDFTIELKTFSFVETTKYIGEKFGQDMLDIFLRLANIRNTQHFQCDFFRLLLIFMEGGLYVDIDQVPHQSLRKMGLRDDIDFMSIACTHDRDVKKRRFSNAFIYSRKPGSEFLRRCIIKNINKIFLSPVSDLGRSNVVGGPYIMGDVYREHFKRDLNVGISDHKGEMWLLLDSKVDKPRSACRSDIEWWSSFYVTNLQGEKVMNDRYIGYYTDRNVRDPKQLVEFD